LPALSVFGRGKIEQVINRRSGRSEDTGGQSACEKHATFCDMVCVLWTIL
jgi:hypothetical protein